MASPISKNQRSGPKQEQRALLCSQGQPAQRVKVVPGYKGRSYMGWMCSCCGIVKG